MAIDLPELLVPDASSLRSWLAENGESVAGAWLVLHKKGGSVTGLTYAQAVDELLCFGWIDGQATTRDEDSYRVRITPRGPHSAWSARNVTHVTRLEQEGRMTDTGRRAVLAAKADGRWERAYAGPASATVPEDLASAIAANPAAQAMFEVLTSTNRYAMVHRLNAVKREETRQRKIASFVQMLARHETIYPQRRRPTSA